MILKNLVFLQKGEMKPFIVARVRKNIKYSVRRVVKRKG